MAVTQLDIRQSVTRVLQDQLNASATTGMDSTLASINNELTSPGRLIAQSTPSLVVSIGSGTLVNPNTSKNRVLPQINNISIPFTGGTITFPSGTGNITTSTAGSFPITVGASQFIPVLVQLDSVGNIQLVVGTAAGSLGAVSVPGGSSSFLSLGYVVIQSNASSVVQNITNAMLYQFVGGGGSGSSGTGSGTGDDLDSLLYNASFTDIFSDLPSSSLTSVNTSGTNATYSPANKYYTLSYDAAHTVTGTGTSMTLSGTPAYTVVAGDILVVGGYARKIVTVTTQTSYTIEAAFPTNPAAAAATVSQAVYTKDINNFSVDGDAISAIYTDQIGDILLIYNDTSSGTLYNYSDPSLVGYTASADGTSYTPVSLRTANLSTKTSYIALPTSGTNLYLRFFANKASGSGTVNLVGYKAFFHRTNAIETGGPLNTAYGTTNNSTTPVNCTVTSNGTNTIISTSFSFPVGLNPTTTNGSLIVTLNGVKIPRFVSSSIPSGDSYYTETNANTITLDRDYSSIQMDIEVYQPVAIIDSNTNNTTLIAQIQNQVNALSVSSGSKNYVTNGNFETGNTTNWSLFNTTVSGSLPTGSITAGAASLTTFATVSSGQLAGSFSLSVGTTSGTAWGSGQGFISNAFTIDAEDQAKVLTIKAYYSAISGASNLKWAGNTTNNLAVAIYDVTNGVWIQPAGSFGFIQSSGVGYLASTFQTTSNSTQYRIAILNVNGTAAGSTGATTVYFDDISVGPQTAPFGPAMEDWNQNRTFTVNNFGTATTNIWSRRVGDTLEVEGNFVSGTPAAATASITLPLSIDSTKLPTTTQGMLLDYSSNTNTAAGTISGNGISIGVLYDGSDTSHVYLIYQAQNSPNQYNKANANSFSSSGTIFSFKFRVPIAGWSSNSVSSSDTDTRVVAMQISQATPTATITSTASLIKFTSGLINDTHAGFSTSTGLYTAPVSGYYRCSAGLIIAATYSAGQNAAVYIAKNGTTIFANVLYTAGASSDLAPLVTGTIYCNAGDTIAPYVSSVASTPTVASLAVANFFTVERLSGPAVVTATETVTARYTTSAGQSIPNNTDTIVNFDTKDWDSHNAVTTGASWKFTAPTSGKYRVSSLIWFVSSAWPAGASLSLELYKNGSLHSWIQQIKVAAAITTDLGPGSGSSEVSLLAGDTISVEANQVQGGAVSLLASGARNWVTIDRVGN